MRLDFVLGVFVESQKSITPPAEELGHRSAAVRFFEDGFPVDCGGMLITQDAVLTTATCALAHRVSTCLYGTGEKTNKFSITNDATAVHPLYQQGQASNTRYDFAIVKLERLLPASAVIALAPLDVTVGSAVTRVDLSSSVGTEACVVVPSERCLDPQAAVSNASICAAHAERSQLESTFSRSTALVGTYQGKPVLLGFQSSSEGSSLVHSYSRIADAADFIYANTFGIVDPPSSAGGDGDDSVIPDDVLSSSLRYPFACLSSSLNASTRSVVAFHVSPRFLVTNGDWISDRETIKWVLFEDDKIPVKKLWFENDGDIPGDPMPNFIVVIELERAYAQPGVKPVHLPIETTEGESIALQLRFSDPALLLQDRVPSDGNAHLASLSACGLPGASTAEDEGVSCLTAEWRDGNTSRTVEMGFVMLDDKLAGFVSGYQKLPDAVKMRFLPFSQFRRNFMTTVFMKSEQSVELSREEARYRGSAIRFFEDGFPVDCGGMLIAPDAVLTTASCVEAHTFSVVVWRTTDAGRQVVVTPSDIVAHPLFQATNNATHQHNFAVVKLATRLPESAVIALAPVDIPVEIQVVRVDLSFPSGIDVYAVLDLAVCAGSRTPPRLTLSSALPHASEPSGSICAGNANGDNLQTDTSDDAALLSTIDGALVLVGLQADRDHNPSADSYASILDAVEFVNANVVGRKWGNVPAEATEITDELYQSAIRNPFLYLASGTNASVLSTAAVLLSPTVVVSNTEWFPTDQTPSWALFADDKIPIQKIQFEGDYRAMMGLPNSARSPGYLVLIKLERPYVRAEEATSESPLSVEFLDPILLERGLLQDTRSSLGSTSACSSNTTDAILADGVDCVHSMLQNVTFPFARGTSLRMGFLLNGSTISGLGTGIHSLTEDISVPFARLDFEPRHNFIDYTTSLWSEDVVPSHDESTYRSAAVRLIASGKILDCGGMLIAPRFVLTTASCAQVHEITAVLVGFGSNAAFIAVLRNETVAHPAYQSGDNSTRRYNFAIVKLSTAQSTRAPIALAPFEEPIGSDAVRVDLSGGTQVSSCRVLESSQCSSGGSTPLLPVGTICAGDESAAVGNVGSASAALVAIMNGNLVLVGLQVGTDDDPHTDTYASVLRAANFINAYVYDQFWGGTFRPSHYSLRSDVSFVVGLRITKRGQNFCGGVLIASQFVLTAAHCVSDGLVKWATVGYNGSDPMEEIQVVSNSIRIHPKFQSPNMYSFDAAILELATPAYSLPISFDTTTDFSDNQVSMLLSYGTTTDPPTTGLQGLELPLWSRKKCQAVIAGVDGSALCAGGQPNKDACTGDSGSPLVLGVGKHVQTLVGLVSAGYGCGQTGVPGLYTRVSSILDFIAAYTAPVPDTTGSQEIEAPTTSSRQPAPTSPLPSTSSSTTTGTPATTQHGSNQSGSSKTTTAPTIGGGSFPGAITHQELPTATEITKDKVMTYLLGGDDGALAVTAELKAQLTNPLNEVTLYSTGDLSGALRVVAAHDALPLNQRQDRFGSVSTRTTGGYLATAARACG